MSSWQEELEERVSPTALLGYLNFSDGKPDARWQKQLHDALALLSEVARPWDKLCEWLTTKLQVLQAGDGAAIRDVRQAETVLVLLPQTLSAYRDHHRRLLGHLSEADLAQPFFIVRALEAILSNDPTGRDESEVIAGALTNLNDFVSYRPIAILETRPRGEPYVNERFRPIPLFLREVGVAAGRYHDLTAAALEILGQGDPDLLDTAHLDLDLLDELALDVRAYDHEHPTNRRPNYVFGEWDPHHIDNDGRYRRFVLRQIVLDAMLQRVETGDPEERDDLLFESAAVIAGTMLMAAGVCGRGPGAHDSSSSLAVLIPTIARNRDQFYEQLIEQSAGARRARLLEDQSRSRQAFGSARQYVNAFLGRDRATQMQQRALAVLFAEMGYPDASSEESSKIATPSVRFLSEICGQLSSGRACVDRKQLADAIAVLSEIESLLRDGIQCGAIVDPWNVLGFGGLFPLSPAQQDGIRDRRIDDLLRIVEETLDLAVRLCSESAAIGDKTQAKQALAWLEEFSTWWDPFATFEVSDVRRVCAEDAVWAAKSVTKVLLLWHGQSEGKADLPFWRDHLKKIQSSRALALIVDALLEKEDYLASLSLLVSWISRWEQAPLEEGPSSFHSLVLRWMLRVTSPNRSQGAGEQAKLIRKLFDLLEANAEEFWEVPSLQSVATGDDEPDEAAEDDLYQAAYEGVTYQDSTRSDDGAVADGGGTVKEFSLEQDAGSLERRLQFLVTVARLWQLAARASSVPAALDPDVVEDWTKQASSKRDQLLRLLDALNGQALAAPLGSQESVVEHERQRRLKEHLLHATIETAVETSLAFQALRELGVASVEPAGDALPWEPALLELHRAIREENRHEARQALPAFVEAFRQEQLLTTSLADGGEPRDLYRARLAQTIARSLLEELPRLGLIVETFQMLKLARGLEKRQERKKRRFSALPQLFEPAFRAVMEQVVAASGKVDPPITEVRWVNLITRAAKPFVGLWMAHVRTVARSPIERVQSEQDWQSLVQFIQRYGNDFFHPRFLTQANLRGILHHGVGRYVEHLRERPDALARPQDAEGAPWDNAAIRLLEDIDKGQITMDQAADHLELILRTVDHHYQEYKDYNSATAQSDYGENLHVLLSFVRLRVAYDRETWEQQPFVWAHEILAKHGRHEQAVAWEQAIRQHVQPAAERHLARLAATERELGVSLPTVRGRLEERFIAPLALDRLTALIEPAMVAASKESADAGEGALEQLRTALQPFQSKPTGAGLDLPAWLGALQQEADLVRAKLWHADRLIEDRARVERCELDLEELEAQLSQLEQE